MKRINVKAIKAWMQRHVSEYVDECGEVNATKLVEAWDFECASGQDTLDPDHIAWDIGADVATEYEKAHTQSNERHGLGYMQGRGAS
jgi:hypothetical protein